LVIRLFELDHLPALLQRRQVASIDPEAPRRELERQRKAAAETLEAQKAGALGGQLPGAD
jgi:hypothetical protein